MTADLFIHEHADCDSVTIIERRADGEEWVFAAIYPGVTMSVPGKPEVRALARARAQRIIDALAEEPEA